MPAKRVEAAGGVLWRAGRDGVVVALVHRPRYDDWSIPKGKLFRGEHPVLGAVREIHEETGFAALPGRSLGETRYSMGRVPKRVRYWAMQAQAGHFAASDEVDQISWLSPCVAQRRLTAGRDRRIMAKFMRDLEPTWPMLLVRHGSAGDRETWAGEDRDRPLDAVGRSQARALTTVLAAYRVRRVLAADVSRCIDTVAPFAQQQGLVVEPDPLLSATDYAGDARPAAEHLVDLAQFAEAVAVCSQRPLLPDLVKELCVSYDVVPPANTATAVGAYWVAHFTHRDEPRLAGLERFACAT
jgi:phosphohistidine phosphatase SixA/8-oxo-dGTP pyrophosphatase MutT (NUDIX family)